MSEKNYWTRRIRSGHISRRRFVGGAAMAGMGAAAFGLVGCGDDDDDSEDTATATGTGTAATGTATSGTGTATSTATASNQPVKGGVANLVSANNTWDTFDLHRSTFSPVAWLYGYSGLGVVHYRSFKDLELEGGWAESWEQPDETTTTFKIRNNIFWHNKAPLNGRQGTAEDVANSIRRNAVGKTLDGADDPTFWRKAYYSSITEVTAPDESTVVVKHNRPDPFILDNLSGAYLRVLAPEAIEAFEKDWATLSADKVIGNGGFVLDEFAAEGTSRWSRFDEYHADVWLDGIQWLPLFTDQAAQEAAFRQKQIDGFGPTQTAVIEDLKSEFSGEITETRYFAANPQVFQYNGHEAPWNNPNLIGGLFKAFDRLEIIQSVLQGQAVLSSNVPPGQAPFSITEQELKTFDGYKEDRAAEAAEAKQMWEAGGGPALGPIIVDIPDIWEGLYSGGSAVIKARLENVLGNPVEIKIEPYSTIVNKIGLERVYGNGNLAFFAGWTADVISPDPSPGNFNVYNSASPTASGVFGIKVDKVDQLTGASMVEFDAEKRKENSKEAVREILRNYGMGVAYSLNQVVTFLNWNYLHFTELASFVTQHQAANGSWLDPNDPTFEGRPA